MIRPEIKGISEEIIKSFLDRNVFETQSQVIEVALQLLLERQIEEESAQWDEQSSIDSDLVEIQLSSGVNNLKSEVA